MGVPLKSKKEEILLGEGTVLSHSCEAYKGGMNVKLEMSANVMDASFVAGKKIRLFAEIID